MAGKNRNTGSGLRVAAGLGVVCVLALSGMLHSIRVAQRLSVESRDPYGVELAMRRFAPARVQLPRGAVAAYFTDVPMSTDAGVAAFLAAQHAVAPVLLVAPREGEAPEWAVGNFSRPQDFARPGYQVAADLGNGVVLYRREGAR
jgi:hypothetical protein